MNTHDNNGFPMPENQSQGENQATVNAWNEAQHTDAELPTFGTETQQATTQEQNPFQVSPEQPTQNETPGVSESMSNNGYQAAEQTASPFENGVQEPVAPHVLETENTWSNQSASEPEMMNTQAVFQQETPVQNQVPLHGMPIAQPKMNKKKITLIILLIAGVILLPLGGLYGFGVYGKIQNVESLKQSRSKLQQEKSGIEQTINKDETLVKLNSFLICYTDKYGLHGGGAFSNISISSVSITKMTQEMFNEKLEKCKEKVNDLKIDGASEKVDEVVKDLENAYKDNLRYVDEAQKIVDAWKAFDKEFKPGSTSDEAAFNRLRQLAGEAAGVDPASLGTSISYYSILIKSGDRLKAVDEKQTIVKKDKISNLISNNNDGKSEWQIEDELGQKQTELSATEEKIKEKDKEISTKESEVWNPFK